MAAWTRLSVPIAAGLLACDDGGAPSGCPDGYGELPDLESCYLLLPEAPASWVNARIRCDEDGAVLAIPDSGYEALAIATLLSNAEGIDGWVGLSDLDVEDTWVTVLGMEATVLPWALNEPDGGAGENCAKLRIGSALLFDSDCTNELAFTCERPR